MKNYSEDLLNKFPTTTMEERESIWINAMEIFRKSNSVRFRVPGPCDEGWQACTDAVLVDYYDHMDYCVSRYVFNPQFPYAECLAGALNNFNFGNAYCDDVYC